MSRAATGLKDLRAYPDYRAYLLAFYEAERKSNPSLSFTKFSERLGFPESSLRMILSGKRNLTVANIHELAKILKFSLSQTSMFESMVLRDQASSKAERQYYGRRLKEVGERHRLEERRVSDESFLREWFGPALLIYLRDQKADPDKLNATDLAAISRQLGAPVKQLADVVAWYREQGYFDEGAEVHYSVDKLAKGQNQAKQFIKQSFLHAARCIDNDYASGRSLFSVKTFSIDDGQIQRFGADYKALLEKYMQETRAGASQTVLQVSFAATRMIQTC